MGILSYFSTFFSRPSFPSQARFVLVGLGNPGEKYEETRHNVGFRVVDAFCNTLRNPIKGHQFEAQYCVSDDGDVIFVKPLTFMNRSGDAVGSIVEKLGIPIASVLVLVDDFNIPIGSIRIRPGGSDGGHNGLKSITGRIGTTYPRLRVGIGPLPEGVSIIDFVLGNFSEYEEDRLKEVIPRVVSAMKLFMTDSIDVVMNKFNT